MRGTVVRRPAQGRFSSRRVVVALALLALAASGLAVASPTVAAGANPQGSTALRLSDRVLFGAHVGGMNSDPSLLPEFEEQVGRQADIASVYHGYAGDGQGGVFPGATERALADGGRRQLLIGWNMGPTRLAEWAAGDHDAYLSEIAVAARSYPYDLYVRPWPEMNGDWASYQPTADGRRPHGGTYREFRQAWRHVVTFFEERGVTNLRWVFNADAATYAATTPVEKIWPGRRYVDVLGLDGFNWGKDEAWGTWRSFTQIFRPQYRRLTALHPTAPVWVCETASKEPTVEDGAPVDPANDKGAWIRSAFSTTSMPRLQAVVWFDEQKERDWRVASSSSSLRAIRAAVGRG